MSSSAFRVECVKTDNPSFLWIGIGKLSANVMRSSLRALNISTLRSPGPNAVRLVVSCYLNGVPFKKCATNSRKLQRGMQIRLSVLFWIWKSEVLMSWLLNEIKNQTGVEFCFRTFSWQFNYERNERLNGLLKYFINTKGIFLSLGFIFDKKQ